MAAPTATVRATPDGQKLGDGKRAFITFASNPNIALWEEEVSGGGWVGDDPIETTDQFNEFARTYSPGELARAEDLQVVCGYDPAAIGEIQALINNPDTITTTWGDGTTQAAYGYLRSAVFGVRKRGEKPKVTLTIVFTNQDPSTCEEELPVLVAGTGTASHC